MPAAHAAAALTASAAARRRARHAAAALLPPVLPYLPRHTCPLRSAVSPSLPEANAAAGVLPEPFPASHWKATLQRGAKCLLVPTEAAAQELVDVIGQERFNGATVVNLNAAAYALKRQAVGSPVPRNPQNACLRRAGPGNFARFLYNNTAARVVCVNFANVFDTELQYILSDFSSSPHIRPIDLTVAQLVELARLYDCWPFRPPLENAFQE
ncbi:MAG: hypothetical protein BJ554DRAFT_1 [Olpidium bornovanus]|uniref:Uncharacterized protein n=1 Tax=Olpidium bornovanus TaxID=278681 RepID=A0A8H7ZUM3_9FUNG|nr:MAG: hypothetical protein BJ554DRAFT_1 [Olpidium bornovanus]